MAPHTVSNCDSDSVVGLDISQSDSNLDRKFDISIYGEGFDLNTTMYDQHDGLTLVPCPAEDPCGHCGRRPSHLGSIIIAIDGACRGNGTAMAQGAIGVYFGYESEHNISERIVDVASTSQKNELRACLRALEIAMRFKLEGGDGLENLDQVLVKADSEYVVKGMTEWILKWRKNGYRNVKGLQVTNVELFKAIDHLVEDLFRMGVQVLFWHVPRARNREADALCNAALDAGRREDNRAR